MNARPSQTPALHLVAAMGMAGDMFCSSLLALGAPQQRVLEAMHMAAGHLGEARIELEHPTGDPRRVRLDISLQTRERHLPADTALQWLEDSIETTGLRSPYATFARTALHALVQAEQKAHHRGSFLAQQSRTIPLRPIGVVHSPYTTSAPAQPSHSTDNATNCSIELMPELAPALAELERFSHVWILAYLHRTQGYDMFVKPPWDQRHHESYGLFATRSPRRPNPIALTKARVLSVQDNILLTSNLDLFDGTPVLDIKPYVQLVDEFEAPAPSESDTESTGRDNGWIDSDDPHLELHRKNIPHDHGGSPTLHEAMDILIDIVGAATCLQELHIDLDRVSCAAPVRVGGGTVRFSHGMLEVPTPATANILQEHHIPFAQGPVSSELLTPTGAAILAALSPTFVEDAPQSRRLNQGWGLGTRRFDRPNELESILLE